MLIEPGESAHTFDASSIYVEFLSETMSEHGRMGGLNGIRGTLRKEAARLRRLTEFTYGTVTMYLSPNDIDRVLAETVWGMTESPSDTFTLDDSLPYFGMLIDTDSTVDTTLNPMEFTNCKISEWRIAGRAPQFGEGGEPEMIILQMSIMAEGMTPNVGWPGSPPSLPSGAMDAPYIFSDTETGTGMTLSGSVRDIQKFLLSVNMNTYAKYVNSLTAHSHRATTRDITLAVQLPLNTDTDDLYDLASAGAAGSLLFTNGAYSSKFNFGRVHFPNNSPVIKGKQEVPLELRGFVTGTGATADLAIVNDNTT